MNAKCEIDAVLRVAAVYTSPAFHDGLKKGLRRGGIDGQMLVAVNRQQSGIGKLILNAVR